MKKQNLKAQIEKDLALLLLEKLYNQEIDFKRAQEMAKFILKAIPENISDGELMKVIPKLDDNFTELCPIVLKYLKRKEEMETNQEIKRIKKILGK